MPHPIPTDRAGAAARAQDPATPARILGELYADRALHPLLVRNPNTPARVFWQLAMDLWWEALENPALPVYLFELADEGHPFAWDAVASMSAYPRASDALLARAQDHFRVLATQREDRWNILRLLASDRLEPDYVHAWARLGHAHPTGNWAVYDLTGAAAWHLAQRGPCPPELAGVTFADAFLAHGGERHDPHPEHVEAHYLASAGLIPLQAAERTAEYDTTLMHFLLADHPQVPPEARERHHYAMVKLGLRPPTRTPDAQQTALIHAGGLQSSASKLATLLASGDVAALPIKFQHDLARFPAPLVRAYLAQQPTLPTWMRELLARDGDARVRLHARASAPDGAHPTPT